MNQDDPKLFGECVASLSLGCTVPMEFKRKTSGSASSVLLPRNSVVWLTEDARYRFTHAISARKSDVSVTRRSINESVTASFAAFAKPKTHIHFANHQQFPNYYPVTARTVVKLVFDAVLHCSPMGYHSNNVRTSWMYAHKSHDTTTQSFAISFILHWSGAAPLPLTLELPVNFTVGRTNEEERAVKVPMIAEAWSVTPV